MIFAPRKIVGCVRRTWRRATIRVRATTPGRWYGRARAGSRFLPDRQFPSLPAEGASLPSTLYHRSNTLLSSVLGSTLTSIRLDSWRVGAASRMNRSPSRARPDHHDASVHGVSRVIVVPASPPTRIEPILEIRTRFRPRPRRSTLLDFFRFGIFLLPFPDLLLIFGRNEFDFRSRSVRVRRSLRYLSSAASLGFLVACKRAGTAVIPFEARIISLARSLRMVTRSVKRPRRFFYSGPNQKREG